MLNASPAITYVKTGHTQPSTWTIDDGGAAVDLSTFDRVFLHAVDRLSGVKVVDRKRCTTAPGGKATFAWALELAIGRFCAIEFELAKGVQGDNPQFNYPLTDPLDLTSGLQQFTILNPPQLTIPSQLKLDFNDAYADPWTLDLVGLNEWGEPITEQISDQQPITTQFFASISSATLNYTPVPPIIEEPNPLVGLPMSDPQSGPSAGPFPVAGVVDPGDATQVQVIELNNPNQNAMAVQLEGTDEFGSPVLEVLSRGAGGVSPNPPLTTVAFYKTITPGAVPANTGSLWAFSNPFDAANSFQLRQGPLVRRRVDLKATVIASNLAIVSFAKQRVPPERTLELWISPAL